MRVSTLSMALSGLLVTAILILALLPPAVRVNTRTSAGVWPAKRVAIFCPVVSSYVTVDEGLDHIMAASKPALEQGMVETMRHLYPAVQHIPVIGNSVIADPEQVLYLRLDAVFVYAWQADILKKAGQPALIEIVLDPKNPIQSRERIWRRIGEAAGKSGRVTALLDKWAATRAALKRQLPLDIGGRPIRVAYVPVFGGEWMTTNRIYYLAYKLGLAGAQDASKDLRFVGKADLEQLLLLDPDVIFFSFNPGDHTTLGEVAGRPEFQAVRAIRERRTYKLPEHAYINEPAEDPFLLTWMAEIFYPDAMPRGLRDAYKQTYWEVYHYAISDDEIDKAIYLDENRHSAGYERFVRKENGL